MDCSALLEHPTAATSTTVVLIDPSGERSFAHCVGPPKLMDRRLFLDHLDLFARSRMTLIGYYSLMPNLEDDLAEVLAAIRATGCRTALDCAGSGGSMRPLDKLLPHLDVYVPSHNEASHQTGLRRSAGNPGTLSPLRGCGDRGREARLEGGLAQSGRRASTSRFRRSLHPVRSSIRPARAIASMRACSPVCSAAWTSAAPVCSAPRRGPAASRPWAPRRHPRFRRYGKAGRDRFVARTDKLINHRGHEEHKEAWVIGEHELRLYSFTLFAPLREILPIFLEPRIAYTSPAGVDLSGDVGRIARRIPRRRGNGRSWLRRRPEQAPQFRQSSVR